METIGDKDFDLIVYDCDSLNSNKFNLLTDISKRYDNQKILITAYEIFIYAFQQVTKMKSVLTLQKPFSSYILPALVDKMLDEDEIKMDRCPRFITNQPVNMMILKNGLLIPTRMKNYSAGGAFLEYKGISLKVGDKIQMNLLAKDITKLKESFQLQAKVVWIKGGNDPTVTERGVGVQFLEN